MNRSAIAPALAPCRPGDQRATPGECIGRCHRILTTPATALTARRDAGACACPRQRPDRALRASPLGHSSTRPGPPHSHASRRSVRLSTLRLASTGRESTTLTKLGCHFGLISG